MIGLRYWWKIFVPNSFSHVPGIDLDPKRVRRMIDRMPPPPPPDRAAQIAPEDPEDADAGDW